MLHNGAIQVSGIEWAANSGRLGNVRLARAAAQAYRQASFGAGLARLQARLTGRSGRLQHLDLAGGANLGGSHYAGLRSVRLDQIVGSEGRSEDFDARFRPLKLHNRERWIRVAVAWLKGLALPAVELIQVGDAYYVRDGNHRISVARAFGQESIDAEVTVWEPARDFGF
jgi:hypothetical protein